MFFKERGQGWQNSVDADRLGTTTAYDMFFFCSRGA